ncbi:hypothetical protein M9Y10_018576 [Tritrichomonas musculus]|uniref:Myb-like domain-containing protein n=1 Tax=Tritrichomonas musculus TaxID=1915356 RepID=A0ABR2HNM5_9EUKA
MTKWNRSEEIELIKRVDEFGNKWSLISNFLPNRSPNAIKLHYNVMKKLDILGLNQKDFLNESEDDKIMHILFKKIRNFEKISQLSQYNKELVITNIIQITNIFPTFSSEMAILLKYIFDNNIYDKNSFINLASSNECMTLLLFCKTFSILNDSELNLIEYVQSDQFFFRGPVFHTEQFNDRNEILKEARNQKAFYAEIEEKNNLLKIENARLTKMVYSLEDQVDKQHQTIELLQQNENSLREYIKEKHNQGKQETEGFFISNEVFVKYPVIRSMINKVLYKTIDESYVKFCSMIQMSSCKTYKRLIDFLPLISLSSCSNYIRPMKHSLKKMLENVQEIPGLIYKVYHEYVPFDAENKVANELFITLGGDAACLKNHPNSAAIYVYKMLPLAKSIPPHAIHIMRTTNGSSPPSVVKGGVSHV